MKHSFLQEISSLTTKNRRLSRSVHHKYSDKIQFLMQEQVHTPIMKNHSLEMAGVPFMIQGMECEYRRFRKIEKKMLTDLICAVSTGKKKYRIVYEELHAISAYLSQMGKFLASISSEWFLIYLDKNDLVELCPSILALIPFRHKEAVHRCIDMPRGETDLQKESFENKHFYSMFTGVGPSQVSSAIPVIDQIDWNNQRLTYHGKIKSQDKQHRHPLLINNKVEMIQGIEVLSKNGEEIDLFFIPSLHHTKIMQEAVAVLEKVLV